MKRMIYVPMQKHASRPLVFDDYVDNTGEFQSYWACLCGQCREKYGTELEGRIDDCGSGTCSIEGCSNDADFYVDFGMNEVVVVDNRPVPADQVLEVIKPGAYFDYLSILRNNDDNVVGTKRYLGRRDATGETFIVESIDGGDSFHDVMKSIVSNIDSGLALVFLGAADNMLESEYVIWKSETIEAIRKTYPEFSESEIMDKFSIIYREAAEMGYITSEVNDSVFKKRPCPVL